MHFFYQYDIRPTLSITSMLLITANVNSALGKYNSSGRSSTKLIIRLVHTNLNANISPGLGCLPNMGFVSYTRSLCRPRYVVYASSAFIT